MTFEEPAVGMDLGTTCSCVAVFRNDQVEIICNDFGARTTPSCVGFTESERQIGDAAMNMLEMNPSNTVCDIKRLIGRHFDNVLQDLKHWPFEVIDHGGKPSIQVMYKEQKKSLTPEEITAMILFKLKETGESHLHKTLKDVVITVPASFNDSQRRATINAGKIAGLNVLRIINESTAAAITYGYRLKDGIERNVLIFNLGGGCLDVSIFTIKNGHFRARSTAGDTHLGGEDFTRRMVDHFVQEFEKKHRKDVSTDKLALSLLFMACEKAKQDLSSLPKASLAINSFFERIHFQSIITRTQFEELNEDLFVKIIKLVKIAIQRAQMNSSDIQEVVIVGGSSRIPKIQTMLQELFNGKKLNKSVNLDEAVVEGAAIMAAFLQGCKSVSSLRVEDVAPFSLSYSARGVSSTLVNRSQVIPTTALVKFDIFEENPTEEIVLSVFEEEDLLISSDTLLGQFKLKSFPGVSKIGSKLVINHNGILEVGAILKSSRHSRTRVSVIVDENWLSEKELKQMIEDAERYQQDDQEKLTRFKARNNFETFCRDLKSTLESENHYEKGILVAMCDQLIQWLNDTPLATEKEMKDKEDYIMVTIRAMEAEAAAIEATLEDIADTPSLDEKFYQSQQTSPSVMKKALSFEDVAMKRSQGELFSYWRSQQVHQVPRKMQYDYTTNNGLPQQDSTPTSEGAMAANESTQHPRVSSYGSSQEPRTVQPVLPQTVYHSLPDTYQDTWKTVPSSGASQQGKSSSARPPIIQNVSPGPWKETFLNDDLSQREKPLAPYSAVTHNTHKETTKTDQRVDESMGKKIIRKISSPFFKVTTD